MRFSYILHGLFHFQRNPKMELSKQELLKLLSYLEGELEAREVVIAALKVWFCPQGIVFKSSLQYFVSF